VLSLPDQKMDDGAMAVILFAAVKVQPIDHTWRDRSLLETVSSVRGYVRHQFSPSQSCLFAVAQEIFRAVMPPFDC